MTEHSRDSEWTVNTLKEHMDDMLSERDRRYTERDQASKDNLDKAFQAAEKISLAANAAIKELKETVTSLREYKSGSEQKGIGFAQGWVMALGIAIILGAIMGFMAGNWK